MKGVTAKAHNKTGSPAPAVELSISVLRTAPKRAYQVEFEKLPLKSRDMKCRVPPRQLRGTISGKQYATRGKRRGGSSPAPPFQRIGGNLRYSPATRRNGTFRGDCLCSQIASWRGSTGCGNGGGSLNSIDK